MFYYLMLFNIRCLMLYHLLLHYLKLHHINGILFRVSLLMLQYFNPSVFDVAFFEFALLMASI